MTLPEPLICQPAGEVTLGGYIVTQAIPAASATVAEDVDVYSSQSSFLHPISAAEGVLCYVHGVAEGKTFITRLVHAVQFIGGPRLYMVILSFQMRNSVTKSSDALACVTTLSALCGHGPDSNPSQAHRKSASSQPNLRH
ncbi:hypothetical protein S40285_10650 [Stachybotrys chlorohalonatus IBT 40285]|uniref:Acyl-CoA thioesterase-like N-terminal HotDog domain-containing protein n=1 Tax=Stachybotrys chlorohalonatus (strain IBT 40285) TaxID=1283841 RepID=A0A084R0Z3_STAC4|nr:hypothetical protein S40285_10650 [Stachybotrys chlorohalonata IBT 40285]